MSAFESVPKEKEIIEKESPQEEVLDSYEKKYESEIKPLFEMLKPDSISLEEFEESIGESLFEEVKLQQVARGDLIVPPEQNLDEIKTLLNNKLKQVLKDNRDHKKRENLDPEFVKNAKIALLYQNDDFDIKERQKLEYGVWDDDIKSVQASDIKNYLLSGYEAKLSESDLGKLMKTRYRENLSNIGYFNYNENYSCNVPESLVLDILKKEEVSEAFYYILERSDEKKYSNEVFSEMLDRGLVKNAFKRIDKFKEIDYDLIKKTEEYNNKIRS